MKTTFPILFVFLILSGCSTFDKEEYIRRDRKESIKLISLILTTNDDEYLNLDCIRERDHQLASTLDQEDNFIAQHLDIGDEEQTETVKDLVEKFKWSPSLLASKTILTEEEIKVFTNETESEFLDFREFPKCPKGYIILSKPVFNTDFDKAIVHIGQVCGFLCGSGEYRLYKQKDGAWEFEEVIRSWVS